MLQMMSNPNSYGPRTFPISQPVKQPNPRLPTQPFNVCYQLVALSMFLLYILFLWFAYGQRDVVIEQWLLFPFHLFSELFSYGHQAVVTQQWFYFMHFCLH